MQPGVVNAPAHIDRFQNILLDRMHDRAVVKAGRALKMQEKGTEVHIDRSDDRRIIVRYDALRVQEAWAVFIDLDARAVVALTRACLPHMERGSRIIEVASAAAFYPLPYMNVYAASKAFVLRYTRALRWELHGSGITVTALCPTWVKTGFEAQARKSKDAHAVNHLLFAQNASTVVSRALFMNRMHAAVACCSIPSFCLRIIGKIVPNCITMWGWNLIRRL